MIVLATSILLSGFHQSAVRPDQEGKASGANNAIREVGGVFGVAVLASVFSASGSYASPQSYVDGLIPAMWVGTAIVGLGAVTALAIPARLGRHEPVYAPRVQSADVPIGLEREPVLATTEQPG